MRYCFIAFLGLVLVAGCGRPRPCLVIPMQLELARTDRDQVREQVRTKEGEIERLSESVEITRKRVEQLRQEQADLGRALDQQAADSVAAAGRKQ